MGLWKRFEYWYKIFSREENRKNKSDYAIKDMIKEVLDSDLRDLENKFKELKKEHETCNLEKNINCSECDKKCESVSSFENHKTDEDVPSTSKCGKCDYESDSESDLNLHLGSTESDICDYTGCLPGTDINTNLISLAR